MSDFEQLWVPYRSTYSPPAKGACPFCSSDPGEQVLVLWENDICSVRLNKYPYNPGHLLVAPKRHVASYSDLTAEELAVHSDFTQQAIGLLEDKTAADGYNIGINQGSTGGASIPGHLHQHIVPRWSLDNGFISVLDSTRLLPQLLEDTKKLLLS